jgi:hypothetical protein
LSKFFGSQSGLEAENVIVTRWEAPTFFYDEATPQIVSQAAEQAFAAVGLQLGVIILGSDPEHNFNFP